jgi:hypothetical protein
MCRRNPATAAEDREVDQRNSWIVRTATPSRSLASSMASDGPDARQPVPGQGFAPGRGDRVGLPDPTLPIALSRWARRARRSRRRPRWRRDRLSHVLAPGSGPAPASWSPKFAVGEASQSTCRGGSPSRCEAPRDGVQDSFTQRRPLSCVTPRGHPRMRAQPLARYIERGGAVHPESARAARLPAIPPMLTDQLDRGCQPACVDA